MSRQGRTQSAALSAPSCPGQTDHRRAIHPREVIRSAPHPASLTLVRERGSRWDLSVGPLLGSLCIHRMRGTHGTAIQQVHDVARGGSAVNIGLPSKRDGLIDTSVRN